MRMRESMHNSGALRQQQAMSFSHWAASLDRSRRADLYQLKLGEWHICISKPITRFNRENGSLPVVSRHSKMPFLKHPNTPLMTQDVTFPPQSSLHYCMYLTVCLSSSEDLICALNMSLWMSISWRRFCIAYNDRGNNQLNITFKNRNDSVGSLKIRRILQCER